MKPYMIKQTITIIPLILAIVGCTGQQAMNLPQSANTDYTRPLPEGKEALIQVPLEEWPDFGIAWQSIPPYLSDHGATLSLFARRQQPHQAQRLRQNPSTRHTHACA